jgi:hypothetical protein
VLKNQNDKKTPPRETQYLYYLGGRGLLALAALLDGLTSLLLVINPSRSLLSVLAPSPIVVELEPPIYAS